MYLSLSLYLSVPSYFSLSLPFCWSGHVFSWSPPVLQGFRFGLEGWKSLNPAQWMKQSVIEWVNDQGRSRAARAAKNIRIKSTHKQTQNLLRCNQQFVLKHELGASTDHRGCGSQSPHPPPRLQRSDGYKIIMDSKHFQIITWTQTRSASTMGTSESVRDWLVKHFLNQVPSTFNKEWIRIP